MLRRTVVVLGVLGLVILAGCTGPYLPPVASFTACPNGYRNGLDVQFSSTSQTAAGHGFVFFQWDFGDGAQADDYYGWMSHRYDEPGTYTVSLTVTDDRGAKATAEQVTAVTPVVELRDVEFVSGYLPRAVGEVVNQSPYFLYSVVVKAKFYDQEGIRVAETVVDITSIDPGERVRFVAEAPQKIGAIASAVASIQSFAAECSGNPIPVPVTGGT